jgi:predicted acylesterase/phospholipase RssA
MRHMAHGLLRAGVRVCVCVILLALMGGCTVANKRLNHAAVPLERRAHNDTHAAIGAEVPHQQAGGHAAFTARLQSEWLDTWYLSDSPQTRDDGIFVGLALSGGGSRSANFSAACMFQLQRLGILQNVDYISAVSGGSLPAAYYCTHDAGWNPHLVQRKLTHSFATDVIVNTFLPWNLAVLTFSDYDRGDLLARSFQKTLFSRRGKPLTFADLRADRPRLLINPTNLQSGKRFVFSDEAFDQINSDLGQYPIAYACAASSAVPVLVHHVTLRDYSTVFDQYVHLMDGGIVDNLGIRSLIETYDAHQESARQAGRPSPYSRGAIFIVIDAKTAYDAKLSDKGDLGLIDTIAMGAGLASTALLERASSATLSDIIVRYSPDDVTAAELRGQIDSLEKSGYLQLKDKAGQDVRVLHLALPRVNELTDQPFESFGSAVNSIQTYFNISDTEAYHLYLAADLLCTQMFRNQLESMARTIEGGKPQMNTDEH